MQEQSITKGGKSTTTARTLRTGYTFSGWNAGEKTGDITLYAKWTVKAENVVNAINNLTEGTHNIFVVGEIDETTVKNIGEALRSNENAKVNLDLSETTGLTKIEDFEINGYWYRIFDLCVNLTGIKIPESVVSICNGVFCGCAGLTDVKIPKSVTSIGYNAFTGCRNVIRLSISEDNEYYQAFNNCIYTKDGQTLIAILGSPIDITEDFYLPNITKIDELVFQDGTVINLEIPEGVVCIEDSAFVFCENLVSVKIPKSLKSVNSLAFYGCTNLTTVNYNGTIAQWNDISGHKAFGSRCKIICTDGVINE